VYTRSSVRSIVLWRELFREVGLKLFHRTGVLWMARDEDSYSAQTLATLQRVGVKVERLSRADLEARYPQFDLGPISWGFLEPESGAIQARQAVQALVTRCIGRGVEFLWEAVLPPKLPSRTRTMEYVVTSTGQSINAGNFIFACGPWLPKLFPELLGDLIHPTRQEVFFFGPHAGDRRLAPPLMPTWIDFNDLAYGIPDLEGRGLKVAIDRHGPTLDPDTGDRLATAEGLREVREYLAHRLPGLARAPLLEMRVCQYENTSNGDFLIDRHPAFENVWLVGGGSGHGFKHGPAVGQYVRARLLGGAPPIEARFSLGSKDTTRSREVF
jgi:sarcosine oxidase